MNIYLVRNKEFGTYFHVKYGHIVTWGEQQGASVYTDTITAQNAGMHAFDWDRGAEEKFEVEHLIALRPGVDFSPVTGDNQPIRMGQYYYLPTKRGLDILCVEEIIYQRRRKRSVVSIVTDKNALPQKPGDLYQGEAAARRARFEKMADMGMYADEKDKA